MSIVKVFNTEDVRQMIFKYKMKYNLQPIYLKMALPLKYVLYMANICDREQEKIREQEQLEAEREGKSYWSKCRTSAVGLMRAMGYWWREFSCFYDIGNKRHNELVKCKMNDDRIIYVYGYKKTSKNTKFFKFSLVHYNRHKRNYRALVKALRIMKNFKGYYENKIIKLVADYIKKKEMDKKHPCPICNKLMNKSSIKRHINSKHK